MTKLSIVLLLAFSFLACTMIPKPPKIDWCIGDYYTSEKGQHFMARCKNQSGTKYSLPPEKLDMYIMVHPDSAVDLGTWLQQLFHVLKTEAYK